MFDEMRKTIYDFNLDYARGGKIQAIKELRLCTGIGLKESKDIVEAIHDGCSVNAQHSLVDLQRQNQDMSERLFDLRQELDKKNRLLELLIGKLDKSDLIDLLMDA